MSVFALRYLQIRNWVDRDLKRSGKPVSAMLPLFPFAGGMALWREVGGWFWLTAGVLIVGALFGECFVAWRASRIIRAVNMRAARHYERQARYALPPEYAASESAILAARRRSRKKSP